MKPYARKPAVDRHFSSAYAELRNIAERWMRVERPGHTLQPTALVHEAYLRILEQPARAFADHGNLVAAAVTALRRILVDHARRQHCGKRGGGRMRVPLEDDVLPGWPHRRDGEPPCDLISLDAALARLGILDPDKVAVVELRFFGGLTSEETASALGITTRSVERRWEYARAWLFRELNRG